MSALHRKTFNLTGRRHREFVAANVASKEIRALNGASRQEEVALGSLRVTILP
jgi:hypothetical protein